MNHGFVKVAAASLPLRVADCDYNARCAVEAVERAGAQGVRVLVLPELCLTGYTCHDLFGQELLLAGALEGLRALRDATAGKQMLVFAGVPFLQDGRLYNCAAALFQGRILALIPKTYIPNYGEFYEARQFSPAPAQSGDADLLGQSVYFGTKVLFSCPELPALTVGCEICEDLWAPKQPSVDLAQAGATVLVNLSASPEVVGKRTYRRELVTGQSARLTCGYVYACASSQESTQDLIYAGHNLIAENGVLLGESPGLDPDLLVTELDVNRMAAERARKSICSAQGLPTGFIRLPFSLPLTQTRLTRSFPPAPFVPSNEQDRRSRCEEVLTLQATGLQRRLEHTKVKTAVVGLSGGLDSTLALLVMVRAADRLGWDRKRLLAVTMPCFGTTGRTRNNAQRLAQGLGVSFREIPIGKAVAQHFRDIGLPESDRSVTYENSQARERTQVLMDLANREGGLVVGTGDLSELALGWATYNGDHMSMYAVNAGVPKTLVRHMVDYVAQESSGSMAAILRDILATPVSPELLPPAQGEIAQRTEDLVGPYELHDFFLYYVVRCGFRPSKIYRLAQLSFAGTYEPAGILHWLKTFYRRFFQQQFKRSCLPDGPKVGSVALSPRGDWRMPSDAQAGLWLQELETLEAPPSK